MRRPALALIVLALLVSGGVPSSADPPRGTFVRYTYAAAVGDPGARDYWVYKPPGSTRVFRPMVVFLHGCNQTAPQAATATRLNELADLRNFIVVYPEQRVSQGSSAPFAEGNGIGCWNWFLTDHQVRDRGEPATIAGITRQAGRAHRANGKHMYIAGVSAGGAMAVNMAAAYPDLYAAAGEMAGCAYRTCADTTGQLAYGAMGSRARMVPMFIENGTADPVNPVTQADALAQSWLGVADLVADGAMDGSTSRMPTTTETYGTGNTPNPGGGDPCIHPSSFTCPGGIVGFQNEYPHTVQRWLSPRGCAHVEQWTLHGLAHAIPYGPPGEPYTDPLGPDISSRMLDFLFAHRLGALC